MITSKVRPSSALKGHKDEGIEEKQIERLSVC